jgi:hypothetical protein
VATSQLISTMSTPLLVFNALAVFEAVDPVTGAPITGVTVTNPVVAGVNLSGTTADNPPVGPFMLVPGPGS